MTIPLFGKGFFTWKLPRCEEGDPDAIVATAKAANLTHLVVKVADGTVPYYGTWGDPTDWVTPLVQKLHAEGLMVWGWHYIYGANPVGEANLSIKRIQQLELDGLAIDAEKEYKEPGKAEAAKRYMTQLRNTLGNEYPLALSSYRFPSLHPQIPWREFLQKCTINMPQVYWMGAHNPGAQLERCVKEFQAMSPNRPIIPTGLACIEHGFQPSPEEEQEFLETAEALNLSAVNYWMWDHARSGRMPGIWETIAEYNYPGGPVNKDICQLYIEALNTHDPIQVSSLYTSTAVHTTPTRTIQGIPAIQSWYTQFINQILPDGIFTLTGFSGTGASRHFTWTATSSVGEVNNGNDTLGIIDGKISYHLQTYTITA